MKIYTTNYYNTFIAVAEDCSAAKGEIPAEKKGEKTIAGLQFDMISKNPYRYTADDVVFSIFAQRNDLTTLELDDARTEFFSKGQPCLRTSALGKRYGWGVHYNKDGRIAVYGFDTDNYQKYSQQSDIIILKAMRSKK